MSENTTNNTASNAADGSDHGSVGHEAHPKPVYDDVNIPVVVLLGILSAILTFVSIAFVQGLYFNWQESIVKSDWNSRTLTPQEKTIVDQKQIRNGFYETKDGKIFVSVDVAARKMIGKSHEDPTGDSKGDHKKAEPKPTPPGPDPGQDSGDKDKKPNTEPAKKATEPAKKATEPAKKATEPAKKATEPAKKATEPAKKATEPAKKATEPAKKATEPKLKEKKQPESKAPVTNGDPKTGEKK